MRDNFSDVLKRNQRIASDQVDKLSLLHIESIKEIASIEQAKYIQIEYDPNQPSPMAVYKDNIDFLKDKIVALNTTSTEIKENVDFINRYKNILRIKCETLKEAEDISYFIKEIQ